MGKSNMKTCDPNLQVIIATLIGIDLARGLDIDEQNILANLLNIVATVLATIATVEDIQKIKTEPEQQQAESALPHVPVAVHTTPEVPGRQAAEQEELRRQIEQLKQQVEALEDRLDIERQ